VPNREWEAVARSGATGAGRREADSRKEGTRASNDASSFFVLLSFCLGVDIWGSTSFHRPLKKNRKRENMLCRAWHKQQNIDYILIIQPIIHRTVY
jgi:hypothetical protein